MPPTGIRAAAAIASREMCHEAADPARLRKLRSRPPPAVHCASRRRRGDRRRRERVARGRPRSRHLVASWRARHSGAVARPCIGDGNERDRQHRDRHRRSKQSAYCDDSAWRRGPQHAIRSGIAAHFRQRSDTQRTRRNRSDRRPDRSAVCVGGHRPQPRAAHRFQRPARVQRVSGHPGASANESCYTTATGRFDRRNRP